MQPRANLSYVLTQSNIQEAIKAYPKISARQLALVFGVGYDSMTDALKFYGMQIGRQSEYKSITDSDILEFIHAFGNTTDVQIASAFNTSRERVGRVRRSNPDIPPSPKTKTLPLPLDELKDEIVRYVLNHRPSMQAIAEQLNVSTPTIYKYVKILIKEGRLDYDQVYVHKRKRSKTENDFIEQSRIEGAAQRDRKE